MAALIIIDMGYGTVRAGLATDAAPTVSFAADPHWQDSLRSEANFRSIFDTVFNQLKVSPASARILIAADLTAGDPPRTMMTNVLKRDLKASAVGFCDSSRALLYTCGGRQDGAALLLDSNKMVLDVWVDGLPLLQCSGYGGAPGDAALSEIVYHAIALADRDYRAGLFKNVYLFGAQAGAAQQAAIAAGLPALAPVSCAVNVQLPVANDPNAAWRGAKAMDSAALTTWV